jgi:HlyD family secretion protein
VEARIVVWQGDDVLQVPLGALFRDGDGWAAFVADAGTARLRPVRVGHMTMQAAEVLGGLAPGERVILHPSDQVHAGTRVSRR